MRERVRDCSLVLQRDNEGSQRASPMDSKWLEKQVLL